MAAPVYTPAEMTARLIAFDTVSHRSNLPLIAFVEDYLRAHGLPFFRAMNETGDKAALFTTIGPTDKGGVCLSGHVDVVPIDGQDWSSPPFEARIADGRLYGRGSCDMKGFVATALALAPDLKRLPLKTPIHLAISYDEEVSCLGSLGLIERFGHDLPKPVACIVGEPTLMQVVDAHKSVAGYETTVTGRAAHSALPALGANAIHAAALVVSELDRLAGVLRERGDPSGRFAPGYSTMQVGTIAGGEAINIVPAMARLVWEVRGLPGLDRAEIPALLDDYCRRVVDPRLREAAPEAGVSTREYVFVPGLAPDPGSLAEQLALRLAGRNHTETVSYGTEAGHFQSAGVPTVVCGPGSIEQAHRADEFIALEQLDACADFLRKLAATLC